MLSRTLRLTLRRYVSHIDTSICTRRSWSSITPTQTGVTIRALDLEFPYVWLRDSCRSSTCINPSTQQKLHRTSDIPLDIKPLSMSSSAIRLNDRGELEIDWSDGHHSVFSRDFLETYSDERKFNAFHKDVIQEPWDTESIRQSDLFIPYERFGTPGVLAKGIVQLMKFGLLFVTGVPHEKTGNEECELRKLAEMFGEIRPTFYGLLWDVMNKKDSTNIAYTNLDLGPHMDLLYFQHPPRWQILHCIQNRVQGGESCFVDALAVAEKLRRARPDYFGILTKAPVAFHYINDGHHLHYEHPTIELAPPSSFTSSFSNSCRRISHINYSPPFQAPLPLDTPTEFYLALKEFSNFLNDGTNTYRYTLKEGDAALFDNRRLLHARTAFYEDGQELKEGEASRWLKGCYLEADTMMDRGRMLRKKLN